MFNFKKRPLVFGLLFLFIYGLLTTLFTVEYNHVHKYKLLTENILIISEDKNNEIDQSIRIREVGLTGQSKVHSSSIKQSSERIINLKNLVKDVRIKNNVTPIVSTTEKRRTYKIGNLKTAKSPKSDLNEPLVHGRNYAKKETNFTDQEESTSICPKLGIVQKHSVKLKENISCLEHQPSESGCKYVQELYPYDVGIHTCKVEKSVEICTYDKGQIFCTFKSCGVNFDEKIYVHIFNKETGHVEVVPKGCSDDEELNFLVYKEAQKTVRSGYNFMFLSCNKNETQTQLLLLDKDILKQKLKLEKSDKDGVNINIVLFDSIARAHFYRSLKATINTFNEINSDPHSETEVLDFQLFQALHGHSAENNHGLFTGHVFPSNISDSDREELATGIDYFINHFKKHGYNVMYQDDMCWEAFWGIRMDLGGAEEWKDLSYKIDQLNLDDTGLLFASCKIMKQYKVEHIFNLEDEEKVCFNGQQQDEYYLQYLYERSQKAEAGGVRKSFSFSNLNVAHDGGGVRVQTIDESLSEFVSLMSRMENTLTIILADHGNGYTDYVYLDMEGRYEMFHPSLFMIVPKGVQQYIGDNVMTSLRLNQKRLLTMIDLHHGLLSLTSKNKQASGIFTPVSINRGCSDVPLRLPNLCVCQGWNTPVQNTTEMIGQMEFAIGTLNNIITASSKEGKCKRLVPTMIVNVLQRKDGAFIKTTFDILTQSGYGFTNRHETITVEVKSILSNTVPSREMQLLSNDRLSKFGPYKKCSDTEETFRLCVCDTKIRYLQYENNIEKLYFQRTSLNYDIFKGIVSEEIKTLEKNLAVIVRSYNEPHYDENENEIDPYVISLSFEVVNVDNTHAYIIHVDFFNLKNIKPTQRNCSSVVKTNTVTYLCTLVRSAPAWSTFYDYDIYYKKI